MWPTTVESLRRYPYRAPCGCWYRVPSQGTVRIVEVSPNRAQRCFKHMKVDDTAVETEIIGTFDA